jgi:KAP family P-loop domain/TIR domain
MAIRSSGTGSADGYDVYISFPRAEAAWAQRLYRDLSESGLDCFLDQDLSARDLWEERLQQALDRSNALVVLWSAEAKESEWIQTELARFEAGGGETGERRPIVPLILGDADLIRTLPRELASRQAVIVGHDTYAAGTETDSEEWRDAVKTIAKALEPYARLRGFRETATRSVPSTVETEEVAPAEEALEAQAEASLPSFSRAALRALSYAAEVIGTNADSARLRTAALLGALRASAVSGMGPTTGDVVKLVLDRQADRDALQTLAAAGAAAGLEPVEDPEPEAMTVEALLRSNVRQLVEDAIAVRRRVGADGVHLHHVLATGVDPAVSADALAELGITLSELREHWRASIRGRWPDESSAAWDEILTEPATADRGAGAPPSARVHPDRWTTDDRLDYALYAKAIEEFIRHRDAKPPMVISVQAPWGQGKTSLMRMVQRYLDPGHPDLRDERHDGSGTLTDPPSELTFGELQDELSGTAPVGDVSKPKDIHTVWFNAWKYQNSEQVWAGLAHSILSQLPARLKPKDRELFWLRLQLRRIDPGAVRADIHRAVLERFLPWLAGLAVLALIAVVTGIALLAGGLDVRGLAFSIVGPLGAALGAVGAWLGERRNVLARPLEGAYLRYVRQPDYTGRLGYLHLVEEDMRRALDLLTSAGKPAVIFIDDLDRCSPAKVGEVIEAMNLFLAGEYPNCAFVLGIDAEVVAASMEVVHHDIIAKLADRHGELGWHFMDKFVQLPFVIPRLTPKQRAAYLRGLFATPRDEETPELVAEAEQLKRDVQNRRAPVDELARRVGALAPQLAAVAPERARELGEQVVAAGAQAFSDSDPEVIVALEGQMQYLSDNPRTIKRAVNLYRFHRFVAYARQASTLPLDVATPEQIGRWVVVIIRWPHFVRWLQTQDWDESEGVDQAAARVLAAAAKAGTGQAFEQALKKQGIEASWADDAELWEFLRAATPPELGIALAASRGLW